MFWLVLRLFGGSRDYLGHGITINMLTASENEVLEQPECSQRVYKKNNPYRAWQKLLICKGLLSPYHVCSWRLHLDLNLGWGKKGKKC